MSSISPTLDTPVLGVLARARMEMTTSDVNRALGTRHHGATLIRVLRRLTDSGIVSARKAGRTWLWELNEQHVAADGLIALAKMRETTLDRIEDQIDRWHYPVEHAAVYGSFARNNGNTDIDIDIFIVYADDIYEPAEDADQSVRLGLAIAKWTGNRGEILAVTASELAEMVAKKDPLIGSFRTDAIALTDSFSFRRALNGLSLASR